MKPIKPLRRSLIQTAAIVIPFSLRGALSHGEVCVLAAVSFVFNYLVLSAIHYAERTSKNDD